MARDVTNPVTSYSVTVYGGTGFGWIQLKNGAQDAGYIYFRNDPPETGDFGGSDAAPYVITSQPIEQWPVILDLLRNERPLFIRGFQAGDGAPVSTFFGTSTDEPVGEGE